MPKSEVYNMDCLDFMRSVPDGYFDLLIADPPYGDGLHAEDGGGKGWFTKYNQRAPESDYNKARSQTVMLDEVEDFPAADVAEIVRCRDCKHKETCESLCSHSEDWFCGDGEREGK